MNKNTISLLAAASILAANSVTASAYSTETFSGLDNSKYYTLTADTYNPDINSDAYILAGTSRTVIPQGEHTVCIRGIKPNEGKITAVVVADTDSVTVSDFSVNPGEAYNFYIGGDITEASYILDLGGKYRDFNGNIKNPTDILSNNGVKLARIRLSNNPGKGNGDGSFYLPEGYQDLSDCLKLARLAADSGMDIEFTFNLSDYWSNGERQLVPSDWVAVIKDSLGYDIADPTFLKSLTDNERNIISDKLTTLVYDYVYEVMLKLKEQGTVPKLVSIGNEINGGMLFPFGTAYDMSLSSTNFSAVWDGDSSNITAPAQTSKLARFFNAGYDAVKAVSPETSVVIHLANGGITETFMWTLDLYNSIGAKYDIIGASYYPSWSNKTIEDCTSFCNSVYEKYNKQILIMETGFNWNPVRKDGFSGQLTEIDAYKDKYPPTPTGQKGYLADLFNALKSVKDGACIGAIYWDPLMIHVEDTTTKNASLSGWAISEEDDKVQSNVVENSTLFDFNGCALPSLEVMRNSSNVKALIAARYNEGGSLISAVTITADEIDNHDFDKLFVFGE